MSQSGGGKETWASRVGVILAVTGSAVGLGNFLRFPGLAAQYEGGAFMVPYFIALLVLGLPLAWGEWAMGRFGGRHGYNSSPGIYRSICRHNAAAYLGVLGMIVPVVIYMYYVLIESWCLGYAWYYRQRPDGRDRPQARQLGAGGAGQQTALRRPLHARSPAQAPTAPHWAVRPSFLWRCASCLTSCSSIAD